MPPTSRACRRDATWRRSAVVVLLLQALLWMAGPTIEARAEARAIGATAHVEDVGSNRCPPIHSHLECQICRTLRTGAPTAPAVELPIGGLRAAIGLAGVTDAYVRPATRGAIGSRAPPAA